MSAAAPGASDPPGTRRMRAGLTDSSSTRRDSVMSPVCTRRSSDSDTAVSSPTAKSYFEILVDTMLGRWLPSYRKRPKRRVAMLPKFYFSDVAVVNQLAKRGTVEVA